MNKLIILLSLITLCLSACSQESADELPERYQSLPNLSVFPSDTEPLFDIRLERDFVLNTESFDELIGRLGAFDIDDRGRIFTSDPDLVTVHVLDTDGTYLTSLGREGRGPGEFSFAPRPIIVGDSLLLYDPMQIRVSSYSLDDLKLGGTHHVNPRFISRVEGLEQYSVGRVYFMDGNNDLVLFQQAIQRDPDHPRYNADRLALKYYLMDKNRELLPDKVLEQARPSLFYTFIAQPRVALSDDGFIFSTLSDEFLIEVQTADGNIHYAFYHPFDKVPLTLDDALNHVSGDNARRLTREMDRTEYWPVIDNMLVDDRRRLWISTIIEDFDLRSWWVLEENGELIARFGWPRAEPIEVIRNGYAYTRQTDPETDIQQIVRYRIALEER